MFILLLPVPAKSEEADTDHIAECAYILKTLEETDTRYQETYREAEALRRIYRDLTEQSNRIRGDLSRAERMQNTKDIEAAKTHKEFHDQKIKSITTEAQATLILLRELELYSLTLISLFTERDCAKLDRKILKENT
jgi:hypothetical protein